MFLQGSYPPGLDNPAAAFQHMPPNAPVHRFDMASYEARKEQIRQRASLRREAEAGPTDQAREVFQAALRIRNGRSARRRSIALGVSLAIGAAVVLAHPATRGAAMALGRTLGAALPGGIVGALADHVSVPIVSKGLALAGFATPL
ncbi:hypothetical protein NNJEOMEG_00147 [Fundidesulfovibrio magnetotacticus]|uniref:Uncharacterized protein n=1 Tax=Fundidesulfovibrio magnetotacticus TaxID=2730080 RepID=A0A6V8LHY0_9BACT|nr:hypothetical protein [Fundidesulfovibrio magnetotacticus]GFK92323.1 hypothetical protein NNJEOMEG_00147 [Fundidesulfovibrio magnetotacticus]